MFHIFKVTHKIIGFVDECLFFFWSYKQRLKMEKDAHKICKTHCSMTNECKSENILLQLANVTESIY